MNHYLEIKIRPNKTMQENVLLNKVFTKFHKALFDLKATDIGVSFPEVNIKLGCTVRIHSRKKRLQELQNLNWLGGLSSYCGVSNILSVPDKVKGYQITSRIQPKMTNTKLRSRLIYKKEVEKLSEDELKQYAKQYKAKMFKGYSLTNPYLELQSTSTANRYRIFIKFGKLKDKPLIGKFNYFGLSKEATVPIF